MLLLIVHDYELAKQPVYPFLVIDDFLFLDQTEVTYNYQNQNLHPLHQ